MPVWFVGALAFAATAQVPSTASTARWVLRADPALCVLERRNAEPPVTLSIKSTPGSDVYQVAVVDNDVGKTALMVPASLTFSPAQRAIDGRASIAKLPDGKQVIWMDAIAPAVLDDLASADTATIMTKSGERGSVPIAGAMKAVEAFRRCSADQLIEWGADAGQFAPGGRIPVAIKNRDDWLSSRDLLTLIGKSGLSDIDALFRVGVSPNGIIDDCRLMDDKIAGNIEKLACGAVMNKALFTPAMDASGRRVRGAATFRILLASRPAR